MKNFYVFIFFLLLIACKSKEEFPTDKMIVDATEFAVVRMNENIDQSFELCGQFCDSWADSILIDAIEFEKLNSIFPEQDFEYLKIQYNQLKNKDMIHYLPNISGYDIEKNQEKHLNTHICISPPLFSKSKESWVIFNSIFTRKGYDEFFVVYSFLPRSDSISVVLYSNDKLKHIKGKQHKHSYWFNFLKE